jgi:prepilin-type N-terminal cleavage/methylation domain-containing protein
MARGFTLIEILVATTIMAVTIGVTVAGYNNFNESQRVKQAALTLKNNFRMAQEKAKSAQKPADLPTCNKLVGIHVQGLANANTYRTFVDCLDITNAPISSSANPLIYNLPINVKFQAGFDFIFPPLTQSVSNSGTVTLFSDFTTTTSSVTVNSNGEISNN